MGLLANPSLKVSSSLTSFPSPVVLSPPAGFPFNFSLLDFNVYSQGGKITVNLNNAKSLIPSTVWGAALTQIFHVDLVNGNNSNTGISTTNAGDFTNAVQYVNNAVTLGNATAAPYIILINGVNNPIFNASRTGAQSNHPSQPCAIISIGGRSYFTAESAFTATLNTTYNNVYQFTASNQSGVLDRLNTYPATYVINNATQQSVDPYDNPVVLLVELSNVTSVALVASTANSWYNDGTNTYINRADGAVPTNTNTLVLQGSAFGQVSASLGSIFFQNIEFDGGVLMNNTSKTYNSWFDNCVFRYCGLNASGNGVAVDKMTGVALFTYCQADANGADGFNHHQTAGGPSYFVTVNCTSTGTGRSPSPSNNAWTSHDTCIGVDINGFYTGNHGGTCRSINNAMAWLVGTTALGDVGDLVYGGAEKPTAAEVDNAAVYYLDNCTLGASVNAISVANATSAKAYTRDVNIVQGATVGTTVPFNI